MNRDVQHSHALLTIAHAACRRADDTYDKQYAAHQHEIPAQWRDLLNRPWLEAFNDIRGAPAVLRDLATGIALSSPLAADAAIFTEIADALGLPAAERGAKSWLKTAMQDQAANRGGSLGLPLLRKATLASVRWLPQTTCEPAKARVESPNSAAGGAFTVTASVITMLSYKDIRGRIDPQQWSLRMRAFRETFLLDTDRFKNDRTYHDKWHNCSDRCPTEAKQYDGYLHEDIGFGPISFVNDLFVTVGERMTNRHAIASYQLSGKPLAQSHDGHLLVDDGAFEVTCATPTDGSEVRVVTATKTIQMTNKVPFWQRILVRMFLRVWMWLELAHGLDDDQVGSFDVLRPAAKGKPEAKKVRVDILGGGLAGLTTAYWLAKVAADARREAGSKFPGFDIRIWEAAHAPGGKAASGRTVTDAAGLLGPIKEHGLHLFFGTYENAWRTVREVWKEYDFQPATRRFATVDDAFSERHDIRFAEHVGEDAWDLWAVCPPTVPPPPPDDDAPTPKRYSDKPGDGDAPAKTEMGFNALQQWLMRQHGKLAWLLSDLFGDADVQELLGVFTIQLLSLRQLLTVEGLKNPGDYGQALAAVRGKLDDVEATLFPARPADVRPERPFWSKKQREGADPGPTRNRWLTGVRGNYDSFALCKASSQVLRIIELMRLGVAIASGLIRQALKLAIVDAADFGVLCETLNSQSMSEFLEREGVRDTDQPLLLAYYGGVFAYPNPGKSGPNLAAGVALQAMLRTLFCYRGHMLYQMNAGMGEVVIAPMVHVLSKVHGVQFKYASRLTRLQFHADAVTGFTTVEDAYVAPAYDPLEVGKVVDPQNRAEQRSLQYFANEVVLPEDATAKKTVKLTLHAARNRSGAPPTPHEADGFVVLAIPPAVSAPIGVDGVQDVATLADAYPAFLQVEATRTHSIHTMGWQLWLKLTPETLGWGPFEPVVGGLELPLDTWADMTHLLAVEKTTAARSLHYFCGARPGKPLATQALETKRVEKLAWDWLKGNFRVIFPHFRGKFADLKKAEVLSFIAASTDPADMYVLSTAGSIDARPYPEKTGYRNLVFAGDWTHNSLSCGSAEAAVVAGIRAARAIIVRSRCPELNPHEAWGEWDRAYHTPCDWLPR